MSSHNKVSMSEVWSMNEYVEKRTKFEAYSKTGVFDMNVLIHNHSEVILQSIQVYGYYAWADLVGRRCFGGCNLVDHCIASVNGGLYVLPLQNFDEYVIQWEEVQNDLKPLLKEKY